MHKEPILELVKNNPVNSILLAVSAIVAPLNSLTDHLGAPALFSDVSVALLLLWNLLFLVRTWLIKSLQERQSAIVTSRGKPFRGMTTLFKRIQWSALPPVLVFLVLFVWTSVDPIQHIMKTGWVLCGSFHSYCGERACLLLYDKKNRLVSDRCYSLDDSGYQYLKAPVWWAYRPDKVALRCVDKVHAKHKVSQEMFDERFCGGTIRFD